ncbi:MAG: transcriptional repressor [Candidatus Limivicinus sp.]|nr:transcriptional repressor [Candidatus Limivicinus sp.]
MKIQRSTKQRQLILEAVEKRHDHPTADQIYLDVHAVDERISRGTVYRNLGILSASGQISNVKVPAADRFDSRLDRHYHLFCTCCGRVFDAPVSYHGEYDAQVEAETGFQISRHRTVFEGLCPDCIKKNRR